MHEIELKLQVPAERLAEVEAAVAGRDPTPAVRLRAAYFDTADRRLAGAALALRLRREGRRWVQTLKGAGDDGLTRQEHNVRARQRRAMPAWTPRCMPARRPASGCWRCSARHRPRRCDTLYRTDIARRARELRVRAAGAPQARVELAFDRGRIEAGTHVLAVGELEIELLAGTPHAVIETARRWQARHGLWIDLRSKAERGDLLARGERIAPARGAQRRRVLTRAMDAAAAWQAVLRELRRRRSSRTRARSPAASTPPSTCTSCASGCGGCAARCALFEHPDRGADGGRGAAVPATGRGARRGRRRERVRRRRWRRRCASTGLAGPAPAAARPSAADPAADTAPSRCAPTRRSGWLLDLLAAMQPDREPSRHAAAPPRRTRRRAPRARG